MGLWSFIISTALNVDRCGQDKWNYWQSADADGDILFVHSYIRVPVNKGVIFYEIIICDYICKRYVYDLIEILF